MSTAQARQRVPTTIARASARFCRDGAFPADHAAFDVGHIAGTAAANVGAFVARAFRGGDADAVLEVVSGSCAASRGTGAMAVDCGQGNEGE